MNIDNGKQIFQTLPPNFQRLMNEELSQAKSVQNPLHIDSKTKTEQKDSPLKEKTCISAKTQDTPEIKKSFPQPLFKTTTIIQDKSNTHLKESTTNIIAIKRKEENKAEKAITVLKELSFLVQSQIDKCELYKANWTNLLKRFADPIIQFNRNQKMIFENISLALADIQRKLNLEKEDESNKSQSQEMQSKDISEIISKEEHLEEEQLKEEYSSFHLMMDENKINNENSINLLSKVKMNKNFINLNINQLNERNDKDETESEISIDQHSISDFEDLTEERREESISSKSPFISRKRMRMKKLENFNPKRNTDSTSGKLIFMRTNSKKHPKRRLDSIDSIMQKVRIEFKSNKFIEKLSKTFVKRKLFRKIICDLKVDYLDKTTEKGYKIEVIKPKPEWHTLRFIKLEFKLLEGEDKKIFLKKLCSKFREIFQLNYAFKINEEESKLEFIGKHDFNKLMSNYLESLIFAKQFKIANAHVMVYEIFEDLVNEFIFREGVETYFQNDKLCNKLVSNYENLQKIREFITKIKQRRTD